MPRTIYPTTRPGFFDTKAIAKAKWKQQLAQPSGAAAGLLAGPPTTDVQFHDTKLITLQKILKSLQ